ncbi:uncharacterized protein RSE6_05441 [Rhynchosporium secalis]|uniref:Uncharacterized protein n=1 Tax=Rhynchosporium secalis TaxID=38038 RepID=A0A1E1M7T4_RHYSE|nr:uncharacterized protein RSE6_05441 [Rhynchosporium secalis]
MFQSPIYEKGSPISHYAGECRATQHENTSTNSSQKQPIKALAVLAMEQKHMMIFHNGFVLLQSDLVETIEQYLRIICRHIGTK